MQNIKIQDYDAILKWSYALAKQYIMEHLVPIGVTSARKFDQYKKQGKYLPKRFPRIPDEYFKRKGSWKGWRDFLGNPEQSRSKNFLPYRDAARVAREHKIKNSKDYMKWRARPGNLPSRPEYFYNEWKGWETFLGESYEKPKPRNYAKLNVTDVRIIKHQLQMGISGAVLAREFGVSEMQISRIKHGENWNDI
ncbi:MAG: hypothetical protein JXB49_09270 [Bacteroidales bacterium]|nr:hypothetical protein [Bacteroidales bacterium]